jgi:hypothetical protein
MKKLLAAMFVALLMVGFSGADSGSNSSESNQSNVEIIDLDDNETRNWIIAEATDCDKLKWRGEEGKILPYAPNQQTAHTGWANQAYDDSQIKTLAEFKDGKLRTAVAWKPNGKKCPVTNVKDGNGVVVRYNEVGTEKDRITYKDGEIDLESLIKGFKKD